MELKLPILFSILMIMIAVSPLAFGMTIEETKAKFPTGPKALQEAIDKGAVNFEDVPNELRMFVHKPNNDYTQAAIPNIFDYGYLLVAIAIPIGGIPLIYWLRGKEILHKNKINEPANESEIKLFHKILITIGILKVKKNENHR